MVRTSLHPRPRLLSAAMRSRGINGAELATAVGVTKQFISLLLRGRRRCLASTADAIASELHLPTTALFSSSALCDESNNTREDLEESHMSPISTDDPYLLFEEAAQLTRIKPKTLRHLRAIGEGPPFFKRGQRLMIRRSKLQDWFENTYENAVC